MEMVIEKDFTGDRSVGISCDSNSLFNEFKFEETQTKVYETKKVRVRKIVLCSLIVIQLVIASILNAKLTILDLLPTKYDVLLVAAVVLFNIFTWFSARTKKMTIVMAIMSTVLTTALTVGTVTVFKVHNAVDSIISYNDYEVVKISAVVPVDSSIDSVKDMAGRTVGYMSSNEYIESVKSQAEKKSKFPPQYTPYDVEVSLAEALFRGTEEVMLVESSTMQLLRETEGYMDIDQRVRVIHTFDVKIEKNSADNANASINKDTFVVYLSGSDSRNGLQEVSLSDTNMLAVVNTKKRRIQLINTPRDYYVPIADRNVSDKLTHAGTGGVNRSMKTLENLYDVEVDYYFKICFEGFIKLIDELGGVDVYSSQNFTTYYTCIDFYEGYQHLNGEMALHFARERRAFPIEGDNRRGKNQMEVIKGITKKMTSTELLKNFDGIMGSIAGCFETDIPSDTMYYVVKNQLDKNKDWEISTFSVSGTPQTIDGVSVIKPDYSTVEEAKSLINQCLSNQR